MRDKPKKPVLKSVYYILHFTVFCVTYKNVSKTED